MQSIVFDHVNKYFGDMRAVNDAHFTIEAGEFFTLLGPSGCGKTTLLRTIAGFYHQEEGDIWFGDQKINGVPTHKRNIGMVFQNYAIFPHMSVFDNVAYGLHARKVDKKEIEKRVMEALNMVELSHLRDRIPSDMSGGQQQRIALARAIVIRPQLLLMDEPLSNLDAKLRIKMRSDIRNLQKELGITTIYVTHDQEEALAVSDRIAVMSEGKVQQIDTPQNIYSFPQNQFVANFIGTSNFINAEVVSGQLDTGDTKLRIANIDFAIQLNRSYTGTAMLSLRPERIDLTTGNKPQNGLSAEIVEVTFLGEKVSYVVKLQDGNVLQIGQHAIEPSDVLKVKQQVYVNLNLEKAVIFDSEGQEVLYSAKNSTNRSLATAQQA
ncbi:ABC transporter ATP-binding protein [Paenibacillus albiflavus]|uniref:Spermidine/putrescine import ATP-binding protein PotA n=1 Tax=Paenibacillus albiflavus TaxID=2545760 RepID=A0A4R4E6U0_9BACL|nr:ABC transporter ATP-binding protein [Paenibacillus albiflavus]TCZ74623.1 ABC transporter ATP-binding protein [Paenibacillus albiflavus]